MNLSQEKSLVDYSINNNVNNIMKNELYILINSYIC